jgi:hypothetical protein
METIETRFQDFHQKNPQVFWDIYSHAQRLRFAGQKKLGMKMIFEVLRYESALQTTGDAFKLNNSYAPYYTRLLQFADPELGALFETRVLTAA